MTPAETIKAFLDGCAQLNTIALQTIQPDEAAYREQILIALCRELLTGVSKAGESFVDLPVKLVSQQMVQYWIDRGHAARASLARAAALVTEEE